MRYVAFVRNIMIGREGMHRVVLLEIFERHGAIDPVSYISTGNVGFSVAPDDLERLIDDVEVSIEDVLGRREPLFVRSLARLQEIAASDPYSRYDFDILHRLVVFTQGPAALDEELPIVSDRGAYALLEASGEEIYNVTLVTEDGRLRTPAGIIEKMIGAKVTSRSWNTIQRVVQKESIGRV